MLTDSTAIAAVFPGVGAQYTGMGAVYRQRHRRYRETLDEAAGVLGAGFVDLIFEPGHKSELRRQEEAQLAVLVTGVAMFRVYQDEVGFPISHFAGHSLGEYTALCCAGVLGLGEAIEAVRGRGRLIREASTAVDGTMMWVINLDMRTVSAVCQAGVEAGRQVYVSAVDAPRQGSISGRTDDVVETAGELEARGALVYPLRMEGPYHSPLMSPAANGMAEMLTGFTLRPPTTPVLSTVDGQLHEGGARSAALLTDQLVSPVRWLAVQRALAAQGVRAAVEFGPGAVLSLLAEKTTTDFRVLPMDRLTGGGELTAALRVTEADYGAVINRCLRGAVSLPSRTGGASPDRSRVVAPYRELERISARPTHSRHDVENALTRMEAILEAKGVTGIERQRALNRVLGGKVMDA